MSKTSLRNVTKRMRAVDAAKHWRCYTSEILVSSDWANEVLDGGGRPANRVEMGYHHTQKGLWHVFLYAIAALLLTISLKLGDDPVAAVALPLMAALFATIAASFQHLTVADEGNRLLIHYGPLPLFRKRIWYDDLRHVEAGRTNILDGWGIHWIPGRGWTWNIWGFDCLVIRLDRGTLRVGTDDPQGLVQFLRSRMTPAGVQPHG